MKVTAYKDELLFSAINANVYVMESKFDNVYRLKVNELADLPTCECRVPVHLGISTAMC